VISKFEDDQLRISFPFFPGAKLGFLILSDGTELTHQSKRTGLHPQDILPT
jgi:hypothetical protein